MELSNRKVLVTGGSGFIGSHLAEELLAKGCEVRVFVHYNSFNRWGWMDYLPAEKRNNIEIFTGDIRDPNGVREAMKGCDTVFHLAALIGIPYSYHSPDTYVDTNVKGTLNILQAARQLEVSRIIHTSTSEIYGKPTVSLRCNKSFSRFPGTDIFQVIQYACRGRTAFQHLWSPSIGTSHHTNHHYTVAQGKRYNNPWGYYPYTGS